MGFKFNPFTGTLDLVGESTPPVASAADKITISLKNNTGGTISIMTPVIINSSGEADNIDVSTIIEKRLIGIANENISNGSFGDVVIKGQIKNVSLAQAVGSVVYVNKIGGLTSTIPQVGIGGFLSGDALIKIGTISINEDNPANKDLIVDVEIIVIL